MKEAVKLYKEKEWTYQQFMLVTSGVFPTIDTCFPCRMWAAKRFCYHVIAIRKRTGAPPLKTEAPSKNVLVTPKTRGRNKKRRNPVFHQSYSEKKKSTSEQQVLAKKMRILGSEIQRRALGKFERSHILHGS